MKKIVITLVIVGAVSCSFAQGTFNWGNASTTLVSAGGVATPVASTSQFNFAVFFAPSTTSGNLGTSLPLGSPIFSIVGGTNVNTTAAGRVVSRVSVAESTGTLAPGSTVDFIIRGWNASAASTYGEALAKWNNGNPTGDIYFGQSLVGNDFVLGGGAIGVQGVVGLGASQVGGFNMAFFPVVPEPSSMVLAGLGAASLLMFRRKK